MNYISLFSGMEAAHLAWSPLGWKCKAVAEIEPAACAVLRHRLPDVPNLGSVVDITGEAIAKLGRIDVVIGGSPCQDLSVAGKRAGLAGARSSLFHHQWRIFNAARHLCGARWLVWENVPGAFSSNAGRDFAVVAGTLAGCGLDVPSDGWGNEGVALGDNGLVEWAVLDAQWFGVAQRRRRVFAVLDTGNWTDRPPILLERDSLRGNSAPRREARKSLAGTLAGGARRSGGYSTDDVPLIAMAHGQGGAEVAYDRAPTLTCNHEAPIVAGIPEVAHTLRAEGFDAGEDGPGRGTPLVPVMAFGCKDGDPARSVSDDISPTLRAMGHASSHANAGGQVAVAFAHQAGGVQTTLGYDPDSGTSPTLTVGQTPAVHAAMQVRRLTPRECERLQGAPDDWTLVPNGRGKLMADGPRYKMLGNSFAVPVIRWIGEQIGRAHG